MEPLKKDLPQFLHQLSFSHSLPVIISFLTSLFIAFLYFSGFISSYENRLYDLRYSFRNDLDVSKNVAVLFVNDASIRSMAEPLGLWPWPREVWAALQDEVLKNAEVKATVYDIVFDLPDTKKESDKAFENAIKKDQNVLLPFLLKNPCNSKVTFQKRKSYRSDWVSPPDSFRRKSLNLDEETKTRLRHELKDFMDAVLPLKNFSEGAWGCGSTSFQPDQDGVLRRFPLIHQYVREFYPSLPLLAAANALNVPISKIKVVPGKWVILPKGSGEELRIPIDTKAQMLINFRSANPEVLPGLNFVKAWSDYDQWNKTGNRGELEKLKNKVVIIGSVAEAAEDSIGIPLTGNYPGTFLVATITDNIIEGDFLRNSKGFTNFFLIIGLGLLVGVWLSWFRPSYRLGLTGFQIILFLWFNNFAFGNLGISLPIFAPLVAIILPFVIISLLKYWFERSARRFAEGKLEKYLHLVSNVPGVIFRCRNDRSWTVEYISEGVMDVFGYPGSDFLENTTRSWISVILHDDKKILRNAVNETTKMKPYYSVDYRVLTSDKKTLWIHERGFCHFDPKGELVYLDGARLDITKQKETQQLLGIEKENLENTLAKLSLANEKLDSLNKQKDEFLRIASHDLRNPLTIILGSAEFLQFQLPPNSIVTSKSQKYFKNIVDSACTMNKIIADFLDLRALEDGVVQIKPEVIDLRASIQEVLKLYQEFAERKNLDLEFDPQINQIYVSADKGIIRTLLQNYIDNSIKFCPEGSKVSVTAMTDNGFLLVEVKDSGPGLTDQDLDQVFTEYARLSNKPTSGEKSSGLGLSICKKMAELHNGEVGVRNNPEGGATFWFKIPIKNN